MRALVRVTDEELVYRRSRGLDRWDEMWEGLLRMTPAPSVEHQRILDRLIGFLEPYLRTAGCGRLVSGTNVFRETADYRIPDLSFVAAGRERILHEDGVRGGSGSGSFQERCRNWQSRPPAPPQASRSKR